MSQELKQVNINTNDNYMDEWKANPLKFVEDYLGVKLLPYQKLLLKAMNTKNSINYYISRQKQNELNYTTKFRLTILVCEAIDGEKVLILNGGRRKILINDILKILELNSFRVENLKYDIKDNIIQFNTGGSIELNNTSN